MAKKFDAKAKAKKQKIIAAVLGVLLLGVLAYEVPSLLKSKKPPVSSVPAAGAPVPGLTPVVGGPVAVAPAGVPVATTLSDSDPLAQAGSGQLLSFDRFSSKDPFVQQVDATACVADPTSPEAPTCVGGTPPAAKTSVKPTQPKPPSTIPVTPAPRAPQPNPSSARISVNGTSESVALSKTFPSSDPVFRLVALTRTTAKIGIAGGSLSTGDGTTTLTKGKKVTLMNTADGTRYELILLSLS
jgi:hypothetical protein